jgi:methyl-accepting chemotaxis protein
VYSLGIGFLNRLSFTRKFQIILFTLFLPILYASVVIYSENSHKIERIEKKIIGLKSINTLKPLRILAAKHRGNSAQWFAGNNQLEGDIRMLEMDMKQALSIAGKNLTSSLYSGKSRRDLEQLNQTWQNLVLKEIQGIGANESFSRHSQWISEVDNLIRNISAQSGLILDQNLSTYELMEITVFSIPQLQEQLGQLRGIGAGVATRGSFDSNSFVAASTLYKEINKTVKKIEDEFSLLKNISNQYVPKEINQAKSGVQLFSQTSKEKLLDPDKPTISGKEYFSLGTKAIQQASKLHHAVNKIYQMELERNKSQMINSMILLLTVFALLFLVSCYLFICLRITVDQNAGITQKMAADLEAGTLNQNYHSESQDELGGTIKALKTSYSQLRNVVSKVRGHSTTLSHSSKVLLGMSTEVNTLGEEQKNRVAIISTAATELAVTAQEVSSYCENAASQMHTSKEQASLGASHSHSSADVIRNLANNVRNAGEEIEQLAQQAASISTVIDVIKSIAEQTNLLALNAAIEAARAGEQGRGFAVVADEVRTLATRTQESTDEIENTISNLQQVAKKAVQAMETSCEQANDSEAEANKTGQALGDIENSINQVSSLIEQVATAGIQQAEAANEIAQNILAVDDASSELLEKSQSMSSVAHEVGQDSIELHGQMKSFQV